MWRGQDRESPEEAVDRNHLKNFHFIFNFTALLEELRRNRQVSHMTQCTGYQEFKETQQVALTFTKNVHTLYRITIINQIAKLHLEHVYKNNKIYAANTAMFDL